MPAVRDDGAFYGGPGVPMRSLLLTQVSRMCRKATVESRAVSILSMPRLKVVTSIFSRTLPN